MDKLALDGVRVADFSWQIAGPTCTRYLGTMGAEVIRIESNRRPDPYRERSISHFINQSKKSVTLNLSHPQGVGLAKDIIAVSDVVIENFAPGVIERLGLGYAEIRQVKPDIIMLSSAGLGHTGPDYRQVAYGTLVQCFTGWSALQGYPGREPDIGGIWTDPMVGMMEVFLINAALHRCRETGEGQYFDLSMAEATTMLLPEVILDYSMNQRIREPQGNSHPAHAPHGNYPCRGDDQWVAIAVETDEEWRRLCQVLNRADLASDSRFADGLSRVQNRPDLDLELACSTCQWDGMELTERLQGQGIAAGPSLSVAQLWENRHLRERGFWRDIPPDGGEPSVKELPLVPWRFDGQAEAQATPPPVRGEHNPYGLGELLGMSSAEVERLVGEGIVY